VVTGFRLAAGFASESEPAGLIVTVFATVAGLLNWVPVFKSIPHVPGHLWSVSVEMQFYLVWPLILLGALRVGSSRSTLFNLACGLGIASLVAPALFELEGWYRIYFGSDYRLHGLLVGSAVACWYTPTRTSGISTRAWAFAVTCAVALLLTLVLTAPTHQVRSALFAVPAAAIATTVVVASLLRPETAWLSRWLEAPALRYVGTRSYGLYLWHYALMQWFRMLGLDSVPVAVVLFTLSFAVAEVSYRFVETPASRWGRTKLEARRRAVPVLERRAA
jgi:peptidoglycan/LPS O-acetylase OafA/YrhL